MTMARLSHVDGSGAAKMVDVGGKRPSRRRAVARGRVTFNATAFARLKENRLAKGDALSVARLAGIQAAMDLADAGHKVYLVEKQPSIGGIMAQLDKTFPTNDCSI